MTTKLKLSLEEMNKVLDDQAKVETMLRDGSFGDFVKDYAAAKTEAAGGEQLQRTIQEESQKALADWLKANGAADTRRLNLDPTNPLAGDGARLSSRRQGTAYNRRAPGAKVDALLREVAAKGGDGAGADDGIRAFLRACWYQASEPTSIQLRNRLDSIRNDYGSTVPSDGGFLIPETLRSELLRLSLETSIVRPRARVIPMETLRVPFPTIDETSHASSVYGGMIGYWTEEGGQLTESQAKFGRVVLDAKKLTGYSEVPNELFADAIGSFQALIEELWPEAISFFEDDAFINGSGVGEPLGFLNAAAKVQVTRETADRIAWPDVVAMYSRMLPGSLNRAVWLTSPDSLPEILQMTVRVKNAAGSDYVGGSAVYINNGSEGPPMSILGRPLIVSEKIPKLTDPDALCFVDLGYYLLGDRQAVQMQTSPHFRFQNDATAVRIIERADGRPWLNSALTPKNGSSNTLSPFVGLST